LLSKKILINNKNIETTTKTRKNHTLCLNKAYHIKEIEYEIFREGYLLQIIQRREKNSVRDLIEKK
jgi:hypothetical protein